MILVLALTGVACGGGSGGTARDAGGDRAPDAASSYVSGTFTPNGTPPCLTGGLKTIAGEAQCLVTEQLTGADGAVEVNVPSCNESSDDPCWDLVSSPGSCSGGLTFEIQQDTTNPPPVVSYTYQCAKS